MEVMTPDKPAADWASEVDEAAKQETQPAPVEKPAEPEPLVTVEELTAPDKPETPVAPEPEKKAEPEPEPEQRMVPLQALHAERQKAREMASRMEQMEQYLAQQQQAMQPPPPDPLVQPIEALQYTQQQLQALQEQQAQFYTEQRGQQAQSHIVNTYAGAAKQFAVKTPDFPDAYKHVIATRKQELQAAGYEDDVIVQTLQREEMGLAANALNQGLDPAEVIYKMAKARGFASKPAPAPTPPPVVQIDKQQAKAAAATSISTGGKPPRQEFNAADIASLHGAAFDSAWNKLAANAKPRNSGLFRQ